MARIEHLTTQMAFRLKEGNGTAYYSIGVLDSGQVTGLSDDEIFETILILFYMSTTLTPKAELSLEKVRIGYEGYSCSLKVRKVGVDKTLQPVFVALQTCFALEETKEIASE